MVSRVINQGVQREFVVDLSFHFKVDRGREEVQFLQEIQEEEGL